MSSPGNRRTSWSDFLMSLVIVGVSLYPLYRDEIAKYRLALTNWLHPADAEAEALKQVQREISLMEHPSGD